MKPIMLPAGADDLVAFYDPPPEGTFRGYVWMLGERRMTLVGILYPGYRKQPMLISAISDEAREHPIDLARYGRASVLALGEIPLLTIADENIAGSARFLSWLGFRHVGRAVAGDVWRREANVLVEELAT